MLYIGNDLRLIKISMRIKIIYQVINNLNLNFFMILINI